MVFVFLCLDDVPILFDVVVIHIVIHLKTLEFPKWWKSISGQQQESQAAVSTQKNAILPS